MVHGRRLGCLLLSQISPALAARVPPQSSTRDCHVSLALDTVPSICSSILEFACPWYLMQESQMQGKDNDIKKSTYTWKSQMWELSAIGVIPPVLQITTLLPGAEEHSPWVHTRAAWSPAQRSVAQTESWDADRQQQQLMPGHRCYVFYSCCPPASGAIIAPSAVCTGQPSCLHTAWLCAAASSDHHISLACARLRAANARQGVSTDGLGTWEESSFISIFSIQQNMFQ